MEVVLFQETQYQAHIIRLFDEYLCELFSYAAHRSGGKACMFWKAQVSISTDDRTEIGFWLRRNGKL
jgi:hypothetical protein